ncbi:hypothetical protein WJX72_006604 [[Myrmecia] bisecta]|uniref:Uncharacterized protein n=1 Tax=[Myrmecia] bisecta TaxID=41462 RepID=A0AAW1P2I6_9CHLO
MQSYSTDFLQQFGIRLAQLIAPTIPVHQLQAALRQTIAEARSVSSSPPAGPVQQAAPRAPTEPRKIELVFVHDCRNHGCNRPQCVLCKHNPNKRCTGNFAHKYWVGDRLLAKCEGEIQVELIDAATGERVAEDLSGARVEACILDGNKYNTRCRELGEQKLEVLSECEVLLNQKTEPLLVATGSNNDADSPRVVLKFQGGMAVVPLRDMKVTESSESVLSGTKRPPFRLVVRAVRSNGRRLNIRPAVSEEFVVVTKRTKNLKKQEIPSLDDPISKLNHIGKETVKKLNELKASADEAQLDLALPPDLHRVTKVREFQQLARISEADGHMQQKLKQLLKLSKEKWDSACEHAKTAVQVDNRMRAWYMKNMSVGLLYTCTLGDVRPDCPVALVQNRKVDGADFMEVIPMEHQLPAQREQVHGTCQQAVRLWWEDSHPGWMIFTLGSKHFETLEQIIQAGVGPSSPAGSAVVRVLNSGHADYEEEVSARSEDSAGSGDAHERPATRMATRRAAGMSRASTQSLRRNSSVTHPGMGLAPNSLRSNSLGTSSLSLGPAPERGAEPGAPDTAQLINQLLAVYQANSAGSFQGFPQGQGPHRPAAMPSPGFDFRSEGRGADQGGSDRESRGGAASPAPGPAFNPFETHTAVPFSQAARLAPLTSMPGLPGVLPLNGVSSAWPASVPLAGDTGSSMLPMLMSLNASLLKHGSSLGSLNYLNDYLAGSLPAEAVLYQQQQQAQQAEQRQQSAPIPQQPRQQENGSSGGHDDVQPRHESAPVAGLPALGNGASYASSAALDDRAQHAQHSVTRAGQAQQAQQTPAASTSAAEGSAPETQQRLPAERHQAGASERQSSGAAPSESDQSRQDEPGDLHQPRKSVDARAQPSSLRTAPTQHGDERGQAESAQNRPPAGDQDASEPEHIMRLSASEAGLPQDARAAPQQPSKGVQRSAPGTAGPS